MFGKQYGSWSAGFFRSQLIWIYTVFNTVNIWFNTVLRVYACKLFKHSVGVGYALCALSVLWDKKKFLWTSTLWQLTCPWASINFCYFHTPDNMMLPSKNISNFPLYMYLSRDIRFPTTWYVWPAKAQTSLPIGAVNYTEVVSMGSNSLIRDITI